MLLNVFPKILAIVFASFSVLASAQEYRNQCDENIERLRKDLNIINKKIGAMPPLAKIYSVGLRRYYEFVELSEKGDFRTCVRESERVLNITRAYVGR
jgi:hypothetical protein